MAGTGSMEATPADDPPTVAHIVDARLASAPDRGWTIHEPDDRLRIECGYPLLCREFGPDPVPSSSPTACSCGAELDLPYTAPLED